METNFIWSALLMTIVCVSFLYKRLLKLERLGDALKQLDALRSETENARERLNETRYSSFERFFDENDVSIYNWRTKDETK